MRFFVVFLVLLAVTGYFFWGDLFGPDDDDNGVITVDEELGGPLPGPGSGITEPKKTEPAVDRPGRTDDSLAGLLDGGRYAEALDLLEKRRRKSALDNAGQAAYCRCLFNANRPADGLTAMNELIARKPLPAEALGVVLDGIGTVGPALEKRRLLGRVAAGFGRATPAEVDRIAAVVADLNRTLPRSIDGLFQAEKYTIRPNDSLWEICRSYNKRKGLNVEVGLVRCLNGISGNNIHPGRELTLPGEKVSIRVWKSSWLLCAFLGDAILLSYKVGLGKNDKTPVGSFVIESKLKEPDWNSKEHGEVIPYGDPRNVLGTRWLGFKETPQLDGYGIHGTKQPDSIGKNMSDGCIRLLNGNVEELFELISRGTVVEIL